MKTQHLLFCLLSVMALSKIANADETNFGKKIPSASQVIDALNPGKANPEVKIDDADYEGDIDPNGSSRSINMNALKSTPAAKSPTKNLIKAVTETALSMEITFDYNSSDLSTAAKEQLKPVSEALASGKLHDLSFVVEGHTDAIGGESYNKTLSENRAAAVKSFLVHTSHIEPSVIQIVGKGKNGLLDPNNPDSEVNRRVRIVANR